MKVLHRCVHQEVLSKDEIQQVLEDLKLNEEWYYPCFFFWMSTGLRNSELIGLTWDDVRLEEGEVLISKTLKRDGTATKKKNFGYYQDRQEQSCADQPSAGGDAEAGIV